MGCVATLATIEYIEQNEILSKVQEEQVYMKKQLEKLQSKYYSVGNIKGNVLQLSPPLTISKRELDMSFEILFSAFEYSSSNSKPLHMEK